MTTFVGIIAIGFAVMVIGCAGRQLTLTERLTVRDIRNGAALAQNAAWRECSNAIADALEVEAAEADLVRVLGAWSSLTVVVNTSERTQSTLDEAIEKKCATSAVRFMKAAIKLKLSEKTGKGVLDVLPQLSPAP